MATTTLTKYHGLGNDFLVLVDPDRSSPYDERVVTALCDRHRGIGADGVLRLSRPASGGGLRMELRNADGGLAETSGNGLRCALLAAAHAGILPPEALGGVPVAVETMAGVVRGRVLAGGGPLSSCSQVSVEMGPVAVGELPASPLPGRRAWEADVGNPHLVLIGDELGDVDLATVGPQLEASRPQGTNVELVVAGGDEVRLVVWERGAGLTLACGSGSCAAAAAAREAGLVGDRVVVHNPGGDLLVELAGPPGRPEATLTGPACRVGRVEVDLEELAAMAGAPA